MTQRSYRSIGDVLTLLRGEFPDITISKIRFLESQGLVSPQRSPSGYRKFYDEDIERLRYVLRQQREHFLPLKVIRDRLNGADAEATDEGATTSDETSSVIDAAAATNGTHAQSAPGLVTPPVAATAASTGSISASPPRAQADVPVAASAPSSPPPARVSVMAEPEQRSTSVSDVVAALQEGPATERPVAPKLETPAPAPAPVQPAVEEPAGTTLTIEELSAATSLSITDIEQLVEFGILRTTQVGGLTCFDEEGVAIATLAAGYRAHGIEPRHLRIFRNAVDRETGLIEQLVTPLLRQRNPDAHRRAESVTDELSELGGKLRAALLSRELRGVLGR